MGEQGGGDFDAGAAVAAVRAGTGAFSPDMEATMCAADMLRSLGFDPSRFQQTPWLTCPDCGESTAGDRGRSRFGFLDY